MLAELFIPVERRGMDRVADLDKIIVRGTVSDNLPFLSAADKIIRDKNEPITVRYAALLKMGDYMKIPPSPGEIPESAVSQYIDMVMD